MMICQLRTNSHGFSGWYFDNNSDIKSGFIMITENHISRYYKDGIEYSEQEINDLINNQDTNKIKRENFLKNYEQYSLNVDNFNYSDYPKPVKEVIDKIRNLGLICTENDVSFEQVLGCNSFDCDETDYQLVFNSPRSKRQLMVRFDNLTENVKVTFKISNGRRPKTIEAALSYFK